MTKNKGGRPSKYDEKLLKVIEDYEIECANKKNLPLIEDVSLLLDVSLETINQWCKHDGEYFKPKFSEAIKRIKQKQKAKLMIDGLYGGKEVNSTMAIFLLKANHGMIETSRTELTGKDGKELPAPILGGATREDNEKN